MTRSSLRRIETSFELQSGEKLFRRAWLPREARSVLLIVHGLVEHSGRYAQLADWLASRGIAVHAYDQRGHGRSGGRRAYVSNFSEFVGDFRSFLDRVQREHPGLPCFACGTSMGGLVVAKFLAESNQPPLTGAVLAGAAFAPGAEISRLRMRVVRVLRRLLPRVRIAFGVDLNGLSHDPRAVLEYERDPLVQERISLALAAAILRAMCCVEETVVGSPVPLLVLHGEEDRICKVEAARRFAAAQAEGACTLRVYPGLRHDLFHELEKEKVFQDLFTWMKSMEGESDD